MHCRLLSPPLPVSELLPRQEQAMDGSPSAQRFSVGVCGGRRQVRLLGEYHRGFQASEDPDGQDIADPLYGNANGPDEKARAPRRCRPQAVQTILSRGSRTRHGVQHPCRCVLLVGAAVSQTAFLCAGLGACNAHYETDSRTERMP